MILILSIVIASELLTLDDEGTEAKPRDIPTPKSQGEECSKQLEFYCLSGGTCLYIPDESVAACVCDNVYAVEPCEKCTYNLVAHPKDLEINWIGNFENLKTGFDRKFDTRY